MAENTVFFKHRPLSQGRSFRILELQPAASSDELLSFSLCHVSLTESPKYEAISYTWDNQSCEYEAICDGKKFLVTKNCQDILKLLRKENDVRLIWIDQICINQFCAEDKSINVRQMDDIYEQSQAVLIWTGEFPEELHNFCIRASDRSSTSGETKDAASTKEHRDLWSKFVGKSWFQRMWTLQETFVVCLDSLDRIALLTGNNATISFSVLAMTDMMTYGEHRPIAKMWLTATAPSLKNRESGGYGFRLSSMLSDCQERQCSDPRDKVFALYGIIRRQMSKLRELYGESRGGECGFQDFRENMLQEKHSEDDIVELWDNVRSFEEFPAPDYNKSTSQVYIEAAAWALVSQKDLRMLYLTAMSGSDLSKTTPSADLPSWVPDLGRLADTRSYIPKLGMEGLLNKSPYRAARPIASKRPVYNPIYQNLCVAGVLCGFLQVVGDELPARDKYAGRYPDSVLDSWKSAGKEISWVLYSWFFQIRHKIQIDEEDYWHTLTDGLELSEKRLQSLRLYMKAIFELVGPTMVSKLASDLPLVDPKACDEDEKEHRADLFWTALTETFVILSERSGQHVNIPIGEFLDVFVLREKHSFLLTEKGNFGIALGAIQEQDVVALIEGLDKPVILRKCGQEYKLVTHAIISGLMKGEAWPEDISELRDIVLA